MVRSGMRSCLLACLATVLLLFVHAAAVAQKLPSGPQVLTFFSTVDDTEQPYGLYLPPNYDPSRRYPLVVSLHGAGSNHRLNLRRVFGRSNVGDETDVEATRYFPAWEDRGYIVVSPLARGTMGYQGIAEKDVLDVLADAKRRFSVDENRVYLTGLSMGGGGTLWLGLTRPDIWAAIAPVCPAPPRGTEIFAGNALNLPVRIFQGGADPVVRPEGTRAWVEQLRELGTEVQYDEYPGVMHDSWVPAYRDGQIFDWFDQHVRDPFPERVRFAADQYRYGAAYWVTFDALTPGTVASIDVTFTGDNRLEATTSELQGFTLRLADHPRHDDSAPTSIRIDGQLLRISGNADTISFRRAGSKWAVGLAERPAIAKGPGSEGPLGAAISERHVYIYGTADDPPPEEVARRRQVAERAANWSVYRGGFLGRVMVFPRVLADREVRPSDIDSASLVLFGTKETNSLVGHLAPRLPLHLDPRTEEYGLVYIYPNEDRYVVVSSGLPWWHTPTGEDRRPGAIFAVQIEAMRLMNLEDFLLFEGSPENVVAAGRFETDWRIPAEAAAAMRETGVVMVSEEIVAASP